MIESSPTPTQKSISLEDLAKDAAVALTIQIGGLVLTYLVQIFLARWMGRTEYGIYEYVVGWSLMLAIPAGLGFPRTVLRMLSEYRVRQEWGLLRGIIRGSWLLTLLTGLLLSLIAAGIILLVNHYHSFVYATPLLFGLGLVPLRALMDLQTETARGMQDITLAFAPYQLIWPFLVLCGGFVLLERNHSLTSLPMIGVATLMFLLIVALQLWLLRDKLNKDIEPATPVYAYRQWMEISLVLLLQRAFLIILTESDILMVGSFIGPGAAGMYNAAAKTSMWVGFVLDIVNMVAAPAIATLYTQGDNQGLQKVVSKVTAWIFWPSLVMSLCLLVFTGPVLSLFGRDFLPASWALKVLVLGKLVDALCGSVGSLMIMTGYQNKSFPVSGWCALINLVGNAIAIPRLGILGAAITTSFTLIVWNIWLSALVVKHVGVRPWVFYGLFNQKNESTTAKY